MANASYNKGREALLGADIDLDNDTIKVCLVKTSVYTFAATHQYLTSITTPESRVGTDQTLASTTITDGVFDAANATFTAVTGTEVGAIVIYKDTGSAATSPLLLYLDTMTGLPFTPDGSDVTIAWNDGAAKIFRLIDG